jgi:hypothetical protein
MKKYGCVCAALIVACSASAVSQTSATTPAVSIVFAVLTKSAESKSATNGQEITLRTISEVVVNGEVVIPRGSKLLGRITEVKVKGEGVAQSALSVVIDKAVTKDGDELPVQAIIAAVAAPRDKSMAPDPTYGMLHSSEPKMVETTPGRASSAGELSAGSRVGKTAEVATADMQGATGEPLLLEADSQGAIGYDGLSLSWRLAAPHPVTVFSGKGKNVKLDAGAQMLLRMAPPRSGKRRR